MKLIKKKEDLIVGKHYWVRTKKVINGQTCSLIYKCEYLLNSDKWVGIDDVDFFSSHDIVGPMPDFSTPDFDSYVQEYEKEQRYTRKYHTDVIGLSTEKRTKIIEDWEKEFLPEIRFEVFEMFKRRIELELKELAELLRKKDAPAYQIKDHILSNLNDILVREFKLFKDIYDIDISEEDNISDLSKLVSKFFLCRNFR